jgi:TetR/AcrR family transcriptional regulator
VAVDASALSDSQAPAPGRTRRNRGSEIVRGALINAAIDEFAAHGFEGASTRHIAEAADAHQSQIKYHFDTKDDLWKRCVEVLIDELDAAVLDSFDRSSTDARAVFEATIRGLVHFAARRPELNRIMIHEATNASERLNWLVDSRLRNRHASMTAAWSELVADGIVAPIDADVVYHTVIGAASLLYANAPEAELLGIDTSAPSLVDRHADALVSMFLRPEPLKSEGEKTP